MGSWTDILNKITSNSNLASFKYTGEPQCLIDHLNTYMENDYARELMMDYIDKVSLQNTFCKSAEKSNAFRERGNALYLATDFDGSSFFYSRAIIQAECNSVEMANAYSNRSAAFYHKQEWKLCIKDILMSFRNGYPIHKRFKLNKRLAYSWYQLNNYTKANEALQKAESDAQALDYLSKDDEKDLNVLRSKIRAMKTRGHTVLQPQAVQTETIVTPAAGFHEKLAYASSKIDLIMTDKKRSIISNCDIAFGEVLFVEPAFASVNIRSIYGQNFNCDHCFKSTIYPEPCGGCTAVVYCSADCRSKSWQKCHKWECSLSQKAFWSEIGIGHLATRVFMQGSSSLHKVLSMIKLPNQEACKNNFNNAVEIFQLMQDCISSNTSCENLMQNLEQSYAFVTSLMSHLESKDEDDILNYSLSSILIARYLREKTDFVDSVIAANKDISMDMQQWTVLISAILMMHICQLICNGHSIQKFDESSDDTKEPHFYCLGTGLYPVISIMNHSCDSNVVTSFSGGTQVVRACRVIMEGEEVFNCYGPNIRLHPLKERRRCLLEQYHFLCKCSACLDPNQSNLYDTFSSYICPKCAGPVQRVERVAKCENCGIVDISESLANLSRSQSQLDDFIGLIKHKTKSEVLDMLMLINKAHEDCWYKNNQGFIRLYGWISSICTGLDMYEKSIKFMKSSMEITELVYGMSSLELAEAYGTYFSILMDYLRYIKKNKETVLSLFNNLCEAARGAIKCELFVYTMLCIEDTDLYKQKREKFLELEQMIC